jgi:predicted nucleotidyltransferase
MGESRVSTFLLQLTEWASGQSEVGAVILVGSHARGDPKLESDVDLVIICYQPNQLLQKTEWVHTFGKPIRESIEDWGMVTSLRVWYANRLEVEFGITNAEWIKEPLDSGTKTVLEGGFRILLDKTSNLTALNTKQFT